MGNAILSASRMLVSKAIKKKWKKWQRQSKFLYQETDNQDGSGTDGWSVAMFPLTRVRTTSQKLGRHFFRSLLQIKRPVPFEPLHCFILTESFFFFSFSCGKVFGVPYNTITRIFFSVYFFCRLREFGESP